MRSLVRPLNLAILTGLILTTLPAEATLIQYTDPMTFAAAVSNMTMIDFEGLTAPNSARDYSTSSGLLASGVRFIGKLDATTSYDLHVVNPGATYTCCDFNSMSVLESPSYNFIVSGFVPYIHVVLPANVTAFGVDLMTISPSALTYQATVGTSNFTVPTGMKPARTFFGVTSDTAIPSIDLAVIGTINNKGTNGLIDNVQFGAADAPPPQAIEGGTLLLIGSGLTALGFFRKRLHSPAAA